MKNPRGAAFKSSYRFKRTLRHYGKRKVMKQIEVPQNGPITHLYEPSYTSSATFHTSDGFVYTSVNKNVP
jgi:hypothetical protein